MAQRGGFSAAAAPFVPANLQCPPRPMQASAGPAAPADAAEYHSWVIDGLLNRLEGDGLPPIRSAPTGYVLRKHRRTSTVTNDDRILRRVMTTLANPEVHRVEDPFGWLPMVRPGPPVVDPTRDRLVAMAVELPTMSTQHGVRLSPGESEPLEKATAIVEFKRGRLRKYECAPDIPVGSYVMVDTGRGIDCGLAVVIVRCSWDGSATIEEVEGPPVVAGVAGPSSGNSSATASGASNVTSSNTYQNNGEGGAGAGEFAAEARRSAEGGSAPEADRAPPTPPPVARLSLCSEALNLESGRVQRLANAAELRTLLAYIPQLEQQALNLFRLRLKAWGHNNVQGVDCEYQFDGSRITFFHSGTGQVEREVRQDLQSVFGKRVWLEHVIERHSFAPDDASPLAAGAAASANGAP